MSINGQLHPPLDSLKQLPRAVYGHHSGLSNHAIREPHSHVWGQLSYPSHGVLDIRTDNAHYVALPQQAVWIPAGVRHGVMRSSHAELCSLYIRHDAAPWQDEQCRVIEVSPLLRELLQHFRQLPEHYDEHSADGRLVQVLLDVLGQAVDCSFKLPWPDEPRLQPLCLALQQQPDDNRSLESWAEQLNVSSKTLSRLFIRQTGLTFRAWRQRLRLFSALPRLERGERVTDVAIACGYDSVSAFIHAFGQQWGRTPTEFFRS